ncbi:MAG: hypothetical protein AB7E76_02825 [Deferribacterales bacterium]
MNSAALFEYLKSVFVDCGVDAVNVHDAHKTNILKPGLPAAKVSSADDSLVRDVDLVSITRSATKETLNKKVYDRTVEFEVELLHKTTEEAEDLGLAVLAALPSRKVIGDVRVDIKAEKMQRKVFAENKLMRVKDAKVVLVIKITLPVIQTTERQLITTIDITPKYTEV